jgi:putative peptidoglycan binding protein
MASFGDTGAEVAWLQSRLAAHGLFDPGRDAEVDASLFGPRTQRALRAFQEQQDIEPTGEFDAKTAIALHAVAGRVVAVTGSVRTTAGVPAAGLDVVVLDVTAGVRDPPRLGETTSGADGMYRIACVVGSDGEGAGQRVALEVQVLDPGGAVLSASQRIVDPSEHHEVTFTLDGPVTEYDALVRLLRPNDPELAGLSADRIPVAVLAVEPAALPSQVPLQIAALHAAIVSSSGSLRAPGGTSTVPPASL